MEARARRLLSQGGDERDHARLSVLEVLSAQRNPPAVAVDVGPRQSDDLAVRYPNLARYCVSTTLPRGGLGQHLETGQERQTLLLGRPGLCALGRRELAVDSRPRFSAAKRSLT